MSNLGNQRRYAPFIFLSASWNSGIHFLLPTVYVNSLCFKGVSATELKKTYGVVYMMKTKWRNKHDRTKLSVSSLRLLSCFYRVWGWLTRPVHSISVAWYFKSSSLRATHWKCRLFVHDTQFVLCASTIKLAQVKNGATKPSHLTKCERKTRPSFLFFTVHL